MCALSDLDSWKREEGPAKFREKALLWHGCRLKKEKRGRPFPGIMKMELRDSSLSPIFYHYVRSELFIDSRLVLSLDKKR